MQTQETQTSLKSRSCFEYFSTNGQTKRKIGTDFCNPSIINKHDNGFKEFLPLSPQSKKFLL